MSAAIFLTDRCVSLIIKYELSVSSNAYALAKEENPYAVIEVPWLLRHRKVFRQDVFSPIKMAIGAVAFVALMIELAVAFANWELGIAVSSSAQCTVFTDRIQFVTAGFAVVFCVPVMIFCAKRLMRVKENFSIILELKQYIGCSCVGFLVYAVCWSIPNMDKRLTNIIIQFFIPFVVVNVSFVKVVYLVQRESLGGSSHEVPPSSFSRSPSSEEAEPGNKSAAKTKVKDNKIQKLTDIMDDIDMLPVFEQFMIHEFAVENVYFLKAVKKFKSKAQDAEVSSEQLLQIAQSVFDRFCDENSKLAVNLSAEHFSWIKVQLAAGQVSANLFDAGEREIMELVSQDSLRRFMRSEEFKNKKATIPVTVIAVSVPTLVPTVHQ
eukprot:TRINITY_DN26881_c0_g1_i1.p1 TRINITY_DN26881_c0_g1~~TRINITY_DN26881_c0_g1_i1.p1  ORF type:complete len:414 (-),score=99.89 TRINITY_DN26881_c0_g1_i1:50-1186(-)